ncbi:IQ domain-containing protein IQM2-like [Silene latifolia]|uniref:IQ domain-containing protein IQM2-like n=1 Tax=Silene latifolia TaxID=37657 RepID=UPI003D7753CE
MGVSCGSEGKLTLTNDDIIDNSNLTRQFLFRDWNIGQLKSTVVAPMNPRLRIEALQNRASPETKNIFDDTFWENLIVTPLLESGTLGAKCNTQMIKHSLRFPFFIESVADKFLFDWDMLDIGEGREVNLEKCSRCKLQQQCIKYLGPMERKAYEVAVEDGKFLYRQSGEILDTSSEPHAKWIFVLSTSKALFVIKKKKGTFQHSSFLAGGATSAAGRLVVQNGLLKAVWPHSGHYRPTPENFQDFIAFLTENNVDLTNVKMDPVDEDEKSIGKQKSSLHFRNSSEEDLGTDNVMENEGEIRSIATQAEAFLEEEETVVAPDDSSSQLSSILTTKLTNLEIPSRDELFMRMQGENETSVSRSDIVNIGDGYDIIHKIGSRIHEINSKVHKIINVHTVSILYADTFGILIPGWKIIKA